MILYKENNLPYEDYVRLRESVGWLNLSEEQAVGALCGSRYIVTAHEGQNTVGMGRVIGDGMYFIIVDLVVRPDYQGKGIGRGILEKLLEYIEKNTPEGGRSSVQLIAEAGKETFYEKMGFKRIPHEHCGAGMRKVIYKENP